ncbi:MAG: VWA domain-containing protein, partial [Chloroflexi bacterium]|nr:VWA domain-containing protein [Chloroflexota bacterium]
MNKASVRLIPIIAATLALCSLWLVSTPVHADGLVAVVCPPIILPPGGPADVKPWATPVMPPGAPPVRITPQPPAPPRPFTCPNYLSVKNHDVTVTIDNQVARTRIDETFLNDSGYELEGTYIFPLPDDATIGGLSMWVDGKKLEGRVLERNQARHIYEEIVRRQRDPALLEYVGRNAFQASIFPIPPQSEKRIRIEYSQVLTADNGLVRYVYPLDTTKFSLKPLASVSINVMVHSDNGLKAIYSPSHDVSIVRQGTRSAQVGFEASNVKPDRDFVLYYSISQESMGLNLLSYQSGVEDGFFALLVSPNSELQTTRVVDKDVLLVLDVSGSMQGAKIDQAKRALNYVLDHLNASDRFNIIAFSTGTSSFASSPRPVSERDAAKQFVNGLKAEGSTDINRALLEAASVADAKRPTLLVFLTDGLPTAGEVKSDRILANAIGAVPPNVRLFTFGVGDDVNTVLLDSLAERFRGASGYIRPNEKIDEIVSAFYAKTSLPLLTDVAMNWGNITVGDVYPYPLPD